MAVILSNDFDWEGKPSFEDLLSETEENEENDENADPNVSPHKVRVIEKLPDDGRARATDVSEDMKILTNKLATENLATLPSEIWMMVKDDTGDRSGDFARDGKNYWKTSKDRPLPTVAVWHCNKQTSPLLPLRGDFKTGQRQSRGTRAQIGPPSGRRA